MTGQLEVAVTAVYALVELEVHTRDVSAEAEKERRTARDAGHHAL